VLTEVLRKLTALHDAEPLRWHELLDFVLSWGLRRRPRAERQTVYDAVLASHQQAELRQEMETMAHTIGQTWEQELLAQGRAIGKAEGKAEGSRATLLRVGRKRFGEPDAATVAALEAISDVDRLGRMSDAMFDVPNWSALLATS
jgi:hypothetical protein